MGRSATLKWHRLFYAAVVLPLLVHANYVIARTLKVGAVPTRPPYVFAESHSGIEVDIVREALKAANYSVEFSYMPYNRRVLEMRRESLDGIMTVAENSGIKAYYSKPYIAYRNVVISLKSSALVINSVADLQGKKITAFVGASQYLGEDFISLTKSRRDYSEMINIEAIPGFLFKKKADVIVMDINIFGYYRNASSLFNGTAPIQVHPIFPETLYKVGFHEKQIRDDFNQGLQVIRDNGIYNKILRFYAGKNDPILPQN